MPHDDEDDPSDPDSPDFDLSEAGIGVHRDYDHPWLLRRGIFYFLGILILLGLLLPFFRVF
jgi:hypothetical protein